MHLSADEQHMLVQRTGRPMATDVSVQISTMKDRVEDAEHAADACMRWFEEVDLRLSRFRPESELCALNRSGGRWFAASPALYAVVGVALQSSRASSGRFDPTLLPQIEALGYDRDFSLIGQRETDVVGSSVPSTPPPVSPGRWRGIELDPASRRIRLPADVRLDLGGIAKGWSADVALNRFCLSFAGALVNVGGDLRVHGGPAVGENWSVGIRDPRHDGARSAETAATGASAVGHVAILSFSRGGLATSGALRRWWLQGGKRRHHLLNPQTGLPIELWIDDDDAAVTNSGAKRLIATATALAPTAARAEVAAKVALLRGYPRALREVEAAWDRPIRLGQRDPVDADTAVALVLSFGTGEVEVSGNLEAYLATWGTRGVRLLTSAHVSPEGRRPG